MPPDPIQSVRALYESNGLHELWPAIERRLAPENLAVDYGITTQVEKDLSHTGSPQAEARVIKDFRNLLRGQRDEIHKREIQRLHGEFVERGGRSLLRDTSIDGIFSAMSAGRAIVRGAALVFSSPYFGDVDLSQMNRGFGAFRGGKGLAALFYNLAVITGRISCYPISKAYEKTGRVKSPAKLEWRFIPTDWRRSAVILKHDFESYRGFEGYVRFASLWADGDMHKAYVMAAAFLPQQDFEGLEWGLKLQLRVGQIEAFREHLREMVSVAEKKSVSSVADVDLEGYTAFADLPGIDGNMSKARRIAVVLLSREDFASLKWGSDVPLNTRQVQFFKSKLRTALRQARKLKFGEANLQGYMAFARLPGIDGNMDKAYRIARTLLDRVEFAKLKWGRSLPLDVGQVRPLTAHLRRALKSVPHLAPGRTNFEGYMAFARLPGIDGDMRKAHKVATALLPKKDFQRLSWGTMFPLHVDKIGLLRRRLSAALREARNLEPGKTNLEGYVAFADLPEIGGSMDTAYWVVRALLSDDEFQDFKFGRRLEIFTHHIPPLKAHLESAVEEAGRHGYRGRTNLEGCMAFSRLPGIRGDMEKAHVVASALLSGEDFRRLGWGRILPLRTDQVPFFRRHLERALEGAGSVGPGEINLEGYMAFARLPGMGGDLKKAYAVASVLLSREDFQKLKWKYLSLYASQVEFFRKHLATAVKKAENLADGKTNIGGYIAFAKLDGINGDMGRAYKIASALLSERDFQKLDWGRQIPLHVEEIGFFRRELALAVRKADALKPGGANLEGYMAFARLPGIDGSMLKANIVASALLPQDMFERLKWGKQILAHVDRVDFFRRHLGEALERAGSLETGEINLQGYMAFARLPGIDGDMHKAYEMARSLLPVSEFRALRWGRQIKVFADEMEGVREMLEGGIRDGSFKGKKGWGEFAKSIDAKLNDARITARALLSKHLYLRLGWGRSPRFLAEELILSAMEDVDDDFIDKRYAGLVHKLVVTSPKSISRALAVAVVKWAYVESELLQLQEAAFEKRAFEVRSIFLENEPSTRSWREIYFETKSEDTPEDSAVQDELRRALTIAMESLTDRQRLVVEAVVLDECPLEETAGLLGISAELAGRELEIAIARMREAYERLVREDNGDVTVPVHIIAGQNGRRSVMERAKGLMEGGGVITAGEPVIQSPIVFDEHGGRPDSAGTTRRNGRTRVTRQITKQPGKPKDKGRGGVSVIPLGGVVSPATIVGRPAGVPAAVFGR